MGGPALINGEHVKGTDNFLIAPMMIDGLEFASCEHYFQWAKFSTATDAYSISHCEAIRACPTGGRAWQLGQDRRARLRPDWEAIKVQVMYKANKAKFEQHLRLRAELA